MKNANNLKRDDQNAADQKLIDGLTNRKPGIPSFTFGNTTHETEGIIKNLQERIKTANAIDPPRATWLTAVKANRDVRAKTAPIIAGVRQALQLMFAGSIDTLAEFGLKPRKVRAALTPDEKAAAVLKAQATRKARSTMGSKQKSKIKGTVHTSAPVTPPGAPAPVATPAPASSVAAPRS